MIAAATCAVTVITARRVITLDPGVPDAQAVAFTPSGVLAVGDREHVLAAAGPGATVTDYGDATILPGINDAHLHLISWALNRPPLSFDLSAVGDLAGLRSALHAGASALGEDDWLVAGGWRESWIAEFADGRAAPDRSILDEVTGERPAVLMHSSLHARWLNSAALRAARIDRTTPDPDGGEIVRDADGEPTGLLLEAASWAVASLAPTPGAEQRLAAIHDGMLELVRRGYTSVTDPLVTPDMLREYQAVREQFGLPLRVTVLLNWDGPSVTGDAALLEAGARASGLASGLGDDRLRIGGVKVVSDGAPSHRTAWMHEPYSGGGVGGLTVRGLSEQEQLDQLTAIVATAHRHRLTAQIHATGDRAADAVIDAILAARSDVPWTGDRDALIHGTFLTSSAVERLAENGIPVITSSLMRGRFGSGMVPAVGLDRWKRAFAARELLDAGVVVADSSDAPVTEPSWLEGIATFLGAAPTPEGAPEHLLELDEALGLWTTAPALIEGATDVAGRIARGMRSDLVIVAGDIRTMTPQSIPSCQIVDTYVAGRIAPYGRGGRAGSCGGQG